ncbi:MAG: bifunctional diguanylate cyclase/phosphodiesterase [Epsilonproteobacteria bacterium]|nr:MAG: bifunctional diguanylate cyclase/phosphodiesterase [Campylobacterota bacterium]
MVKKKELFLFFVLIILGAFFLFIYDFIKDVKKDIYTKVETNKIEQLSYLFKNLEVDLLNKNNIKNTDDLVHLLSKKDIRDEYEKHLRILTTPSMKYIYLLAKDKKDRFRFLLDGSKTDRAEFYQKFDVENIEYKTLYKINKAQTIRQVNMENLYLTYLHPVIVDGKTIAVLSVDITTKIQNTILKLIKPLELFFIILIIFIFLLMIMSIMQLFYYFVTRKKIFTDPLTQLYNRNYLNEISPMMDLTHYSIAMLDLDKFKAVNDTYGHKTGDYILAQTSKIFKDSIRDSDILIRYGGEEFLLFIYDRDSDDSALKVCQRIRKAVHENIFNYEEDELRMQVSIGLHENPSFEKNIHEAIKISDKMLYIAKSEGRNRVICYNENAKKKTITNTKGIDFVKEAINDNRVVCYYQPIYEHNTNTIIKYEALVRIIDTDNQIVSPIFFLPEIKDTNIHYKITQRILSIVFDKFKDNNENVSININFSDLINRDIEKTIINTLKNDKDLASRVTFEILESDEIDNIKLFKSKIDLIHLLGSSVSIDDFGSGYSNFRTILDIEANYLKIDGSLIKYIDESEKDFKVVKSIIHFAQVANMKTIAEFVHSASVYEKLLELKVDYMQGYYISEPKDELLTNDELFNN